MALEEWDDTGDTEEHAIDYTVAGVTAYGGQGTGGPGVGETYMKDFLGNAVKIDDFSALRRFGINRHAGFNFNGIFSPAGVDGSRMETLLKPNESTGNVDDIAFDFFFNGDTPTYPNGLSISVRFVANAAVGNSVTFDVRHYRDQNTFVNTTVLTSFTVDITKDNWLRVWKSRNSPCQLNWRIWNETDGVLVHEEFLSDALGHQSSTGRSGMLVGIGDSTTNPILFKEFKLQSISLIPPLDATDPTADGTTITAYLPTGGVGPYTVRARRSLTPEDPATNLAAYVEYAAAQPISANMQFVDNTVGSNHYYMLFEYEDSEGRTHRTPPVAYTSPVAVPVLLTNRKAVATDLKVHESGDSLTFLADETELRDMLASKFGTVTVYDHAINGSATPQWVPGQANYNTAIASMNTNGVDVILHALSINDANSISGITPAQYKTNQGLILRGYKTDVPGDWIGICPKSLYAEASPWQPIVDAGFGGIDHISLQEALQHDTDMADLIAEVNAEGGNQWYQIPDDLYRLFVYLKSTLIGADGLHLTALGYTYKHIAIANEIMRRLLSKRRRQFIGMHP